MDKYRNALFTFLLAGVALGFASCSSGPSEEELAQLDALKAEVASLQKEVASKQTIKADLQKQIADKEATAAAQLAELKEAEDLLK